MPDKTHWKKIVSDPNYLGEADFQTGEEKILAIKGKSIVQKGQSDRKRMPLAHLHRIGGKRRVVQFIQRSVQHQLAGIFFTAAGQNTGKYRVKRCIHAVQRSQKIKGDKIGFIAIVLHEVQMNTGKHRNSLWFLLHHSVSFLP